MTDKPIKKEDRIIGIHTLLYFLLAYVYMDAITHTVKVYDFWQHGEDKYVYVIELIDTDFHSRVAADYTYFLQNKDQDFNYQLRHPLTISKTLSKNGVKTFLDQPITIRTHSDYPQDAIVGNQNSNFFDLYSNSVGGSGWFISLLIFFGATIWMGYEFLNADIKKLRKSLFGGRTNA